MTKTKGGVDYRKAAPAVVAQVREVVAESLRHTYSVSKVYAAHNAVFELQEAPQTCSSCLRNRVRRLRDWLTGHDEFAKKAGNKPEKSHGGKMIPATSENAKKRAKNRQSVDVGDSVAPKVEDLM